MAFDTSNYQKCVVTFHTNYKGALAMIGRLNVLIGFMALGVSGCQSLDSLAKSNDPFARASWETPNEIETPFYTYQTDGGRSHVVVNRNGVSTSPNQPNNTQLVSIGSTTVTQPDGTSKNVKILTSVPRDRSTPH
jgi:hypothetical protein